MIFAHALPQVLDKSKTQTRRIVKDWWCVKDIWYKEFPAYSGEDMINITAVVQSPVSACEENPPYQHRTKWDVDRTYAVQPGLGKPAILRLDGHYWQPTETVNGAGWIYTNGFESATAMFRNTLIESGAEVARIRILRIWQEDVREISEEDVKAESISNTGNFPPFENFLLRWMKMHDMKARNKYDDLWFNNDPDWACWIECIGALPPEQYQAWALEFEVVE